MDPRTPPVPVRKQLWFPRFFLLELVAALLVFAALVLLSVAVDAPLLAIADPSVTPDPSKAPWYFVGLQELLHYYPPAVAGALVPGAALAALLSMPYLGRPGVREPLWPPDVPRGPRLVRLTLGLAVCLTVVVAPAAHTPWVIAVPTALFGLATAWPGLAGRRGRITRWLADRSLRGWLMAWGCTIAVLLSGVGALFRGPGWSWTWPWVNGIF
jgi:hypothetical protein